MTKLEKANPALTTLASWVDTDRKITSRAGAYWLGDVQLTYRARVVEGRDVPLDWPAQVALAEEILRAIVDARAADPHWSDPWQRQRRVLVGLHDETMPEFRRAHFCHWHYHTGDDGCLYQSALTGRCSASIRLALDPRDHEAEGATLALAIDALWAKLAPAGDVPPWRGEVLP